MNLHLGPSWSSDFCYGICLRLPLHHRCKAASSLRHKRSLQIGLHLHQAVIATAWCTSFPRRGFGGTDTEVKGYDPRSMVFLCWFGTL